MSIQRRTVFYDVVNGTIRFHDWATVTTTLGAMAEPFVMQQHHSHDNAVDIPNFDFTDEMTRIDDMRQLDAQKAMIALSGGAQTIGGTLNPREGP